MKRTQKLILPVVIFGCLLVLLWGGLKIFYANRFYPAAKVAGVSVAGMSIKQAEEKLKDQVNEFKNSTIWFNYKKQTFAYEIDFDKVEFFIKKSVIKAKQNNHLSDLLDSNYPIEIKADRQLKKNLSTFFKKHIEQEMIEESILFQENNISYQEAKPEIRFDQNKTWNNFLNSVSFLEESVNIAYQETHPSTSSDLFSTYQKVSSLVNLTPINITSDNNKTLINQINQNDIISWLNIKNKRSSKCKINKGCLLLEKMDPITSQTTFDNDKLKSWTDQLAGEVNKEPTNAQLSFNGKKIIIQEPAQYGYRIDSRQLVKEINNLIDNPQKQINLTVKVDKPPVRKETLAELGIEELIGRGETTFYGSSSSRIHNVRTGASKI